MSSGEMAATDSPSSRSSAGNVGRVGFHSPRSQRPHVPSSMPMSAAAFLISSPHRRRTAMSASASVVGSCRGSYPKNAMLDGYALTYGGRSLRSHHMSVFASQLSSRAASRRASPSSLRWISSFAPGGAVIIALVMAPASAKADRSGHSPKCDAPMNQGGGEQLKSCVTSLTMLETDAHGTRQAAVRHIEQGWRQPTHEP